MEENINVAAILKDKPKGTKLYSILSDGECFLNEVSEDSIYIDIDNRKRFWCFTVYGSTHSFPNGCVLLFPSKEMRDWEKFSWKRGDVLISDCGFVCIFKEWASDDYTKFNGCYFDGMPNAETAKYSKLDNNTAYGYIREIENRCGGKLNLETLEIEKTHSEFKDGDIVLVESRMLGINTSSMIAIFRKEEEIGKYKFSPALCESNEHDTYLREDTVVLSPSDIKIFRPAAVSEKQQLFDALAKKGKAWDAENKMVVDLKPKVEFKPFDKVLCRNSKDDTWEADFFARLTRKEIDYTQSGKYLCVGDLWMYCIPYNEETAHLLGTTDEWKGGEG